MWDEYLAAHPAAKVYRYTTLSNFEALETLFCGRVATEKFGRSSAIAAAQYAITASSSTATSVSGPSSDRKTYKSDSPNCLTTSVPLLMMIMTVLLMYQRLYLLLFLLLSWAIGKSRK